METNRLKHFCVVVETASLTKAADLLGITHGGLHKSLRVLEGDLGFALTVGKGRGIEKGGKRHDITKQFKNMLVGAKFIYRENYTKITNLIFSFLLTSS